MEILWLESWYADRCDGDWEHAHGISIGTLDNPGWRVRIDLIDTPIMNRPFARVVVERSKEDWYNCWVKESVFHGAGGSHNLGEMINVFRSWATQKASGDNHNHLEVEGE
jgi:hypothetical protein